VAGGHARRLQARRRIAAAALVVLIVALGTGGISPTAAGAAAVRTVPGQYASIGAAIAASTTGDTIQVAPGTYHASVDFSGKNLTLVATGGPSVTTIDADGTTGVSIGPAGVISGFTITDGRATFGAGLKVLGAGSVIKGNVFDGNVLDTGGWGAAIFGNGASPTIEANVFRHNSCDNQFGAGVMTFVNSSSPYVTDNVVVDNPCAAINLIEPEDAAGIVANNTIVRNRAGIVGDLFDSTKQRAFVNNIVVDNTVGVDLPLAPADRPIFNHNLVFGNDTDFAAGTTNATGTNANLSADPRFVDAATDFHLQAGSPAIDQGTDDYAPEKDFDQGPRSDDGDGDGIGGEDLGAYERAAPPLPIISMGSVSVTEGDAAFQVVTVPLHLSRPYKAPMLLAWSTVADSATSPADFTGLSNIFAGFTNGQADMTIQVTVKGDLLDEPNERFHIHMTNPTNVTLGHDGTVTIVDNDTRPSIVTQGASTRESDDSGHELDFPVRLSAPSGKTVSVGYTTSRGTAKPGTDYVTKTGVLTFPPGSTQRMAKVWIRDDRVREHTETFTVRYFGPANASIPAANVRVAGTIVDDD
jgi:hypothetical protein